MGRVRAVALILLAAVGIVGVAIWMRPAPASAVVILPYGSPWPAERAPERWVPAKWGWLRRSCQYLHGRGRLIKIGAQFCEASETVAWAESANGLGPPLGQTNGLAAWFVPKGKWHHDRRAAVTTMMTPRVSIKDDGRATLLGNNFKLELLPRVHDGMAALWVRATVMAGGQTNFMAMARTRLSYGSDLLILDTRDADTETNRMEILIGADEIDAQGRVVAH